MKILFIYPGYENLGIEYLSAVLKSHKFETELVLDPILFNENGFINSNIFGKIFSFQKNILHKVIKSKPDLICFSVITDNYSWACSLANEIKQIIKVPIVFGGIHPTSVPERVISEPSIDYVCVGEGDMAIVDLAESIRDKRPTTSIPNIWSKNNDTIFRNQVRPLVYELDSLPFPDKDLYYLQYPIFNDGYLISTSRGCPFKCSYCCNNVYHTLYQDMGKIIRRRSVDNTLAELEEAKGRYRPYFIHFVDDVFNYDSAWLFEFLEKYRTRIKLPFSCYIYPDFVNRSMVKELKEAGCFKIQMGVQVISETKRENILKRLSLQEKISSAIDFFRSEKIYVTCDNIFGFPDESEKELLSLCYFYNEHTPNHCENFWLRYYPKTEITQWALDNNYIDLKKKEEIEKGKFTFGLIKKAEHTNIKAYTRKFTILLSVYIFIPKRLRLLILKKRFYCFIPLVSHILLLIIVRIFNHSRYDFNTLRTINRYLYFLTKNLSTYESIFQNIYDRIIYNLLKIQGLCLDFLSKLIYRRRFA